MDSLGSFPQGHRDLVGLWESEDFELEVQAWVQEVLGRSGVRSAGPLVAHRVRFWAAIFRQSTDEGTVWVKVPNPGQQFEGALLQSLSRLVPDHVLTPLAVHPAHGWILLPDGGATVREEEVVSQTWEVLMAQVARLQVELSTHAEDLARTGLPVLLPGEASEYVSTLTAALARLPRQDAQHLGVEDARAIERNLPALTLRWEHLGSHGAAMSLQLNDASPSNAFRSTGPQPFRFFDLGDAFWSSPAAVLQVPTRMAARSWPRHPAAVTPLIRSMVDAYVEVWSGAHGRDVGDVDAADRLASVHRCESWRRLLVEVDRTRLGVPAPRLGDWLKDAVLPR